MAIGDYTNVLQQFYIAYFGRPADPIGLNSAAQALSAAGAPTTTQGLVNAYATNATVRTLVDNFGNSAESAALYGAVTTPDTITNFVTQIYLNVLDRQPDLAGLLYWSNEISSGRLIPSRVALTILDAATRTADAITVANKLAVANSFTTNLDTVAEINAYSGNTAAAIARDLLSQVDGTTNVAAFQPNVLSAIVTIVGGDTVPGSTFTLTAGLDSVAGTAGNDIINGRISEFASFDTVNGGSGNDTLVLTGRLPTDSTGQPNGVLDGAFEATTSVERLVLTGGTQAQSANATLGQFALAAGLREVVAGGTGGQAQIIDITAFGGALTITGSGNAEVVNVDLGTAGDKTLALRGGGDVVNVTGVVGAAAGSVVLSFVSADVGNGVGTVRIDGPNSDVIASNTGIKFVGTQANQFSVIGADAAGVLIPAQDRGDFRTVILGTSGSDGTAVAPLTTQGEAGNVYINAGAGADSLEAVAGNNERHFLVGGAGDDVLTIRTTNITGRVIALAGGDNDTVIVNQNNGAVSVNLGDGTNSVTFNNGFSANNTVAVTNDDTVIGGTGRDTLAARSANLTAINNTQAGAIQTISGIEALTVLDAQNATTLVTSRVQAGIDTVTLNGTSVNTSNITFDAALASTLNLGAGATGSITVASAGAGTADRVTIANTAAAIAGAAANAFGGQAITATGVETLVINTSAAGTATTQTINGITITPSGTATATVNFVGGNSVAAGQVGARVVDASGLTGTAGLTATTTNTAAPAGTSNTVTGSANADRITLGTAASNVTLGAGNDTLIITAANGLAAGTSVLAGGDGIDTIQTTAAIAATLSVANAFNANQSGFEVLSITQAAAPVGGQSVDTIRVDNLGVNKVISAGTVAGTPGLGTPEVVTFTAPALVSGQTLTFSVTGLATPVTVTAPAAGYTAAQTANAISTAFAGSAGGTVDGAFAAAVNGAVVTLTGAAVGDINPLVVQVTNTALLAQPGVTVTQGVNPIAAIAEVSTLTLPATATFGPPAAGAGNGTATFNGNGGASFTFGGGPLGNANGALANAIKVAADADTDWSAAYVTTVVNGNVVFTRTTAGISTDVTLVDTPEDLVGETLAVTTQGAAAVAGTAETATVTFAALDAGQSVTVDGRTVIATLGALTGIEVSNAFEAGINNAVLVQANGARVSGSLTNYTIAQSLNNAATVFTSITAANVTDLAAPAVAATLPAAPALTTVDGTAAGTLGAAGLIILQNLDSNGTLEITGAGNGGTHEVRIIDSGLNTNDVLNLELTNGGGGPLAFGTVLVANTETLNILTKDTGTAGNTAATQDAVILNATGATSIVVSGNNGLDLSGSNLINVTSFNASGVVGNGTNDTQASLGVTFTGQSASGISIFGGAGADFLGGGAGNDTINISQGGADQVRLNNQLGANAGGVDTITGFTAGTYTAGTGNVDRIFFSQGFASLQDGNGAAPGVIFNATAANTVGDLVLTGAGNTNVYIITNGQATLDGANVKSQITGATAQNGEILVSDGSSTYVLQASSASSSVANLYLVRDTDAGVGVVNATIELVGTINLTNTVADFTVSNFF